MVLRFTDTLPQALYLEPSVIINAVIDTGRFHAECADFLRRINNENIHCITSVLSLDEIWYILIKNLVEDTTGKFLVKSYKEDPECILTAKNDIEKVT